MAKGSCLRHHLGTETMYASPPFLRLASRRTLSFPKYLLLFLCISLMDSYRTDFATLRQSLIVCQLPLVLENNAATRAVDWKRM